MSYFRSVQCSQRVSLESLHLKPYFITKVKLKTKGKKNSSLKLKQNCHTSDQKISSSEGLDFSKFVLKNSPIVGMLKLLLRAFNRFRLLQIVGSLFFFSMSAHAKVQDPTELLPRLQHWNKQEVQLLKELQYLFWTNWRHCTEVFHELLDLKPYFLKKLRHFSQRTDFALLDLKPYFINELKHKTKGKKLKTLNWRLKELLQYRAFFSKNWSCIAWSKALLHN